MRLFHAGDTIEYFGGILQHVLMTDLLEVGRSKALGYLPFKTLKEICQVTTGEMIEYATGRDLSFLVFEPGECRISSGALYFYDLRMLTRLIDENIKVLTEASIPCESCESFINHIAQHQVSMTDPAYAVVGRAFNDSRFRKDSKN